MSSREILGFIDNIAATPGKNDKQALVVSGMSDELFERVCEYAYSPFKTYGLRQIPTKQVSDGRPFNRVTWEILDELISRKLTGNAARDTVQAEIDMLDEQSADLFVRIIRKDLRAGFSESTINKACKGLIPTFPYQRCSLPKDANLESWPWERGVISQEKADGMFANIDFEEGARVSIRSRQGSEFPMDKFATIENAIKTSFEMSEGVQFHGEFLVMRDGDILPRAEGNGVMNSVLSGGDFAANEYPIFKIWDRVPLSSVTTKGKCNVPYRLRLATIVQSLRDHPSEYVQVIPTRIVRSLKEAYAHATELMKLGKEGTVVKHPDAFWKDGTSKEQVKLKLEFDIDLEVVAIVPGNAGTKNEGRSGSLTCRSACGKLVSDVTVKNEKMRDEVDAKPDDWVGRIIAVTANDITLPSESNELHSLFLPRMLEACYRTDKTTADDLDRIFAIKQAAIDGEKLMKEAA